MIAAADTEAEEESSTPVPLDAVLQVQALSIVPEGEEYLVGDPARMEYVLLPEIGIRVIRLVQAGHTVRSATEEIGEDVDVPDFVAGLMELGFVSLPDGASESPGAVSAPGEYRRVRPRTVRPFFSRVAWSFYIACAALVAIACLLRPALLPHASNVFFLSSPLASVACVTLVTYLLACIHEVFHWAAARAEGLDAPITVSRRLYFLVLETDLSRLWGLPRARRYSPLFAGMAFDSVVLCAALWGRLAAMNGWWHPGGGFVAFLGAITLVEFSALIAQFFVFTRTDMYAVLMTATGCVNLWRVNQLCLLGMVRRLQPEQRRELDEAHPADLSTARWYAGIYLLGIALATGFFVLYFLPALARLTSWLIATLAGKQLSTWEFWEALCFSIIVLSPYLLTAAIALCDFLQRWATGPALQR